VDKRNWTAATDFCEDQEFSGIRAGLARIKSEPQSRFIASLEPTPFGKPRWVDGVFDPDPEVRRFVGVEVIDELGLWYPGEPSFSSAIVGETCVQQGTTSGTLQYAGNARFDNSECLNNRRLVCEFCPPATTTTTPTTTTTTSGTVTTVTLTTVTVTTMTATSTTTTDTTVTDTTVTSTTMSTHTTGTTTTLERFTELTTTETPRVCQLDLDVDANRLPHCRDPDSGCVYWKNSSKLPHAAANAECEVMFSQVTGLSGGGLAQVRSLGEARFIAQVAHWSSKPRWVGVERLSDGWSGGFAIAEQRAYAELNTSLWYEGEPSLGADELCVQQGTTDRNSVPADGFHFNDANCETLREFICQWCPAERPHITTTTTPIPRQTVPPAPGTPDPAGPRVPVLNSRAGCCKDHANMYADPDGARFISDHIDECADYCINDVACTAFQHQQSTGVCIMMSGLVSDQVTDNLDCTCSVKSSRLLT